VDKGETVCVPLSIVSTNTKIIDWHLVEIAQIVAQ